MGEFSNTKVGPIPVDWKLMFLNEFANITDCEHKTAPESKMPTDWVSIRSSEVGMGTLDLAKCKFISKKSYEEWTQRKTPEPGNIIFTREAPFGHAAKVLKKPKIALGQRMVLLSVKDSISSDYLMYSLLSPAIQRYIEQVSVGTTAKRIDVAEIEKLPIPIPSRDEQEKIASVLRNIEQQIDTVSKLVVEHQTLKKGLMQRLLTRGIGHTRFKQTKIGEIPESWRVVGIGSICEVRSGISFPLELQKDSGGQYPFIKISDMNLDENEVFMLRSSLSINSEILQDLNGKLFPAGTIILPRRGVAILTNKRRILSVPSLVDNNIMGILPKKIDLLYLYYYLSSLDMSRVVNMGAVLSINDRQVRQLCIPLPSVDEQNRIGQILDMIDKAKQSELQIKQNLEVLKKGLMQVLLTGKVRVKI